jgi:uracil-DNA glycosylase family 4
VIQKAPGADCANCPLRDQPFVPSYGDDSAALVLVGEAPGSTEVQVGVPFVGPSGQLLDAALQAADVDPLTTFKTNAVLCRPRYNEDPPDAAITACSGRLRGELAAIAYYSDDARVIALGKIAKRALVQFSATQLVDDAFTVGDAQADGDLAAAQLGIGDRFEITFDEQHTPVYLDVTVAQHPAFVLRVPSAAKLFLDMIERGSKPPAAPHPVTLGEPERVIITNVLDLQRELATIPDGAKVAIDTESRDLQWYDTPSKPGAPILCVQIAWTYDRAIILVPSLVRDAQAVRLINKLQERVQVCTQNGKYDAVVMYRHGYRLRLDFDTMLAQYVLDENLPRGLKEMVTARFGVPNYEAPLEKYLAKGAPDYSKIPFDVLTLYAAKDVCFTLALAEILEAELIAAGQYEMPFKKVVMRAANALIKPEFDGVQLDLDAIQRNRTVWLAELEQVNGSISELAQRSGAKPQSKADQAKAARGKPWIFNPGSPAQMAHLLYDCLKLPTCNLYGYKPRTTDKKWIQRLTEQYPNIEVLQQLKRSRRLIKMIGSYANKWLNEADVNGRLHCDYRVDGTETGRLSATAGLHQIPRGSDEYGKVIRACIISPPGKKLVLADAKQAELRVLADETRDPFLLEVYANNRDLHTELTIKAYGEKYTKEQRTWLKSTIFAGVYGGTTQTVAALYGIDEKLLQPIQTALIEQMPVYTEWKDQQKARVHQDGELCTRFNRKRRFYYINDVNADDAEKAALNFPIQSTASDITLLALCTLVERGYKVVLTVHDSIIVECDDDQVDAVQAEVVQVMQSTGDEWIKSVPWLVEVDVDTKWIDKS